MALPGNVGYGTVTATFIEAVADTGDAGREPDGTPLAGLTVTFDADVVGGVVRNASAGTIIPLRRVSCVTNSSGVMIGPDGQPGVMLVATDDPDLDPHDSWTWKATVTGPSISLSFSFNLPQGQTVDLASVVPVPASGGNATIASEFVDTRMRTTLVDDSLQPLEVVAGKIVIPSGGGGGYSPPVGGIPKTDLASAVQTSLDKAEAAVPATRTVAGKALTANVALVKGDVGLGNVDNTADSAKPVSTDQATAIGLKYTKPGTGIPKTDLTTAVQTSLDKADAAAVDTAVVKLTGAQTKAGILTFSDGIVVPDASLPQAKVAGLVEDLSERLTSGQIVEGTGVDITEQAGGGLLISAPGTTGPTGPAGPGVTSVYHGTNATATRPVGNYAMVFWVGTVQPNNMIAGDVWFNSAAPAPGPVIDTTNLIHHWRASDINQTDGTAVTTWAPRVGGVNLIAGGSPTYKTTGGPNGKSYVLFDGVDDIMNAAVGVVAQPTSLIVVARFVTVAASRAVVGGTNTTTNRNSVGTSAGNNWNAYAGINRTAGPADTTWHYLHVTFNNTVGNIRVDGGSSQGTIGTESREGLRVAANNTLTAYSNIEVAEIALYNVAHDGTAAAAARTALKDWYALP